MKKIISLILALSFVMQFSLVINAENNWYDDVFEEWNKNRYFDGDLEASKAPDEAITRGEFLYLLNRYIPQNETARINFSDINEDDWFYKAFLNAYLSDIIDGYSDGSMRPYGYLTREEGATILNRVFKPGLGNSTGFNDDGEISYWARESVYALYSNGYINGYDDGCFKPINTLSRAEAICLIDRMKSLITLDLGFDGEEGDSVSGWFVSEPSMAQISTENGCTYLNISKNIASDKFYMDKYLSPLSGVVEINFAIRTLELGGTKTIKFTDNLSREYGYDECFGFGISGSELFVYEKAVTKAVKTIKANEWYNIKLIADTDNDNANVFVNGEGVANDVPFRAVLHNIGTIRISVCDNDTGTLHLKNFTMKNGVKEEVEVAETAFEKVIEKIDLTNQAVGAKPTGTNYSYNEESFFQVKETDGEKGIHIVKPGDKTSSEPVLTYTFEKNLNEVVQVDCDVYASSGSSATYIFSSHRLMIVYRGATFYTMDLPGNYTTIAKDIAMGEWHHVTFIFKCNQSRYDLYIDNELITEDIPFRQSTSSIYNFIYTLSPGYAGEIGIKNIVLQKIDSVPAKQEQPLKGYNLSEDAPDLSAWTEKYQHEPYGKIYEAENMVLSNFEVCNKEAAHGGRAITMAGDGSGKAEFVFDGESGNYSIMCGYIETEGKYDSTYKMYHNGELIDYWYGQFDDEYRHVRRVKSTRRVEKGDRFLLVGNNAEDPTCFDYVSFEDAVETKAEGAAILTEDIFHTHTGTNRSGWTTGGDGGKGRVLWTAGRTYDLWDSSNTGEVWAKHRFVRQEKGTVEFRYLFYITDIADGIEFNVMDGENKVASVVTKNGGLYCKLKNGELEPLGYDIGTNQVWVRASLNLDTKKVKFGFNGCESTSPEVDFLFDADGIDTFMVETPKKGTPKIGLRYLKIFKGYLVNEQFFEYKPETALTDLDIKSEGGKAYIEERANYTNYDLRQLRLIKDGDGEVSVKKTFDNTTGNINMEFDMMMPEYKDKIVVSLCQDGKDIASLTTDGKNICYIDGEGKLIPIFEKYKKNVWYNVRITVNTNTKLSSFTVNKRKLAENIPLLFDAEYINGLSFVAGNNTSMLIDTVECWEGEYICRIPEPEIPEKKDDYIVCVEACDLWREGIHIGYDSIRAFDNRTPILGYYEDGDPEVADIQIKWLLEHGIDAYLTCWYRPSTSNAPREAENIYALEDGFMQAKYFDKIKFGILWENGVGCSGTEDYFNNLLPYWIERYFKNPSYLLVDNKPILAVWRPYDFAKQVGGNSACKEVFDKTEEILRGEGFDGAIFMTVSPDQDVATRQTLLNMGYDYTYTYHFGNSSTENQCRIADNIRKVGVLDYIPTLTQGFGAEAWGEHSRKDNRTLNEFRSGIEWMKENYMKKMPQSSLASKMIFFGNWNEISEGHTLIPSYLSGFGYLDEIKRGFTVDGDKDHIDFTPESAGIGPYDKLYPELWQ